MDINGSVWITDGSIAASSWGMTVAGDWTMEGTAGYTATSGTVEFDDASITSHVYGTTSFRDLTINTPAKRIEFEAGVVFTVSDDLTITGGAAETHVTINSTDSDATPTRFTLESTGGAQSVSFVSVAKFQCKY